MLQKRARHPGQKFKRCSTAVALQVHQEKVSPFVPCPSEGLQCSQSLSGPSSAVRCSPSTAPPAQRVVTVGIRSEHSLPQTSVSETLSVKENRILSSKPAVEQGSAAPSWSTPHYTLLSARSCHLCNIWKEGPALLLSSQLWWCCTWE